jgi:apolipoprotein N-acyltransferase
MFQRTIIGATQDRSSRRRISAVLENSLPSSWGARLAAISAVLLVLAFPDFNLWPLAWFGLVPLFLAIIRDPHPVRAFFAGWLWGTLFFYGTCYWLTYSMIRYGHIPTIIAYLMLVPITVVVGLFPGVCCAILARCAAVWGRSAILLAIFVWPALEWIRFEITGQLWNALGYSQTYALAGTGMAALIQTARWGGVYAVSLLIVAVNAAIGLLVFDRRRRSVLLSVGVLVCTAAAIILSIFGSPVQTSLPTSQGLSGSSVDVIAVQPNVPMTSTTSLAETAELVHRHITLSETGLSKLSSPAAPSATESRVVIWPESPMNFTYSDDSEFRDFVGSFARSHHVSVLFNSQERAPGNGVSNSAVMVDSDGRMVARYDKIRLLPFGEYVPIPRWIPGAQLIPTMVGDFTPGSSYPIVPMGSNVRAGVFICFESAFPEIARTFTRAGADVLINISNDGYLGPTAVMRQHLANAVFRAVENNRPVLRVTNTGISALITATGSVTGPTEGFAPAVENWRVAATSASETLYTRFGDLLAVYCVIITLAAAALTFRKDHFVAATV